ncbi:hypothetical protein F7725_018210, partial [Dissostichus mawsoni]
MMKDSSDWTKLEPEVNSTDEDEASTYSLKSEAGNFECSVSGLRWVCQEKVSFKYQFCSSEEPMKRMEMMKYMPADITVISGKLFEVYLPHWIFIDDIPEILQKFAVLHIDDCGDVVEKVSEVTSSHVKLSEPVFSPRTALMKMGIPVKIRCNVLIYSKAYASCTVLHVYLIPLDPALKETMDKNKKDFKLIQSHVASITTTKERLLKMLEDLGQEEFNKFKWFLRDSDVLAGLPCIPCSRLENSDILNLVDLMSQTYSQKSLEVTKNIFQKINRNDLVQQ